MNKQEAIEQIKNKALHHCGEKECYKDGCEKSIELNTVLEIINQIDEPEKPVIPQFVADWIRHCKFTYVNLLRAIKVSDVDMYNYAYKKEANRIKHFLEDGENTELFAKAWFYGYTVEKPKLYTVEIPNNDNVSLMLIKNNEHIRLGYSHYVKKVCALSDGCTYKLTEEEIRKDFEWAWQAGFAKEVE